MAETLGSLIDKISIMELKIYHMEIEIERHGVSKKHIDLCKNQVAVLIQQRDDLIKEINSMVEIIKKGEIPFRVYRQFKMYNDPKYQREID